MQQAAFANYFVNTTYGPISFIYQAVRICDFKLENMK